MRLQIPAGTHLPTVNECDVRNLLSHRKQTASGPDEFPYWLWRNYSHHLAAVITKPSPNKQTRTLTKHIWKTYSIMEQKMRKRFTDLKGITQL